MEKFDAKFYGEIRKVKDDTVVPDETWMLFLLKDNAFAATLPFYLNKCIELGCDDEHVESVKRAIGRMDRWRKANHGLCKNPDAKGEKLIG